MKFAAEHPLSEVLLNKEAIVFCGAGISLEPPAGLPDWKKLRDFTLEAVANKHETTRTHLQLLLKTPMIAEPGESGLTPEVVASEIAANCQGYFECFRALNDGLPNVNHLYLARLAREGFLSCIVTTNFDLFIEKALEQEGVCYKVYRTEKEFNSYRESSQVALFKLHGCISVPETITSTVEQEARGLSVVKQHLLTNLLRRYYVIFWGYSGSDLKINLDYLQMVSQKEHARGFFWHFLKNSVYTETININVAKLVELYGDKGQIMHGRLPDIFEQLMAGDLIKRQHYSDCEREEWQQKKNDKLQKSLFEWAEKTIVTSHALNIFGNLLYLSGELNSSGDCYLDCINECEKRGDRNGEAAAWSNIGGIYRVMGAYEEALECYAEAEKIAREENDKEHLAIFINNIGKVYRTQGNYLKAVLYYKSSASLNRELKKYKELAIALNNLGMAYNFLDEHERALQHYSEALSISKELGDKQSISAQRNNLGNIHRRLGNYDQALAQHMEVESICRALGDKNSLAICLNNIGTIYRENGYNKKAAKYLEDAFVLAQEIGDIHNCAIFSKNLCIFYEQFSCAKTIDYYGKTLQYYAKALNNDGNLREIEPIKYVTRLLQYTNYVEMEINDIATEISIPPLEDGNIVSEVVIEMREELKVANTQADSTKIIPSMMSNLMIEELKSNIVIPKIKDINRNPLLQKNTEAIMETQKSPVEFEVPLCYTKLKPLIARQMCSADLERKLEYKKNVERND